MSGTSLDGVDAALVEFSSATTFTVVDTLFTPYSAKQRNELLRLFTPGNNEIDAMGQQCRSLGSFFATSVKNLAQKAGLQPEDICAIGSHGQTIRHRPELNPAFTLQIGDPNTIAHNTGITTIADFRRRDMAANGQGAPLAPAFHQAIFHHKDENRIIINIGGIANITWVPSDKNLLCTGFDTGPGNGLMDLWCKKHTGNNYDKQGEWAKSGTPIESLLQELLAFQYFDSPPPKSTGKEQFNEEWLDHYLKPYSTKKPEDIQATLLELTVITLKSAIDMHCDNASHLYICGGGALNIYLMERLSSTCDLPTSSTQDLGVNPEWVEAIAFAWLARQTKHNLTSNLPSVTGATQPVILGGIYPGKNGL
ncbi:anhydro-N-acetylmuramic acid kinase [Gammaproteobacteria bacterium 42_54_T18]|nr:anhydro-N-acetylmuramic acid kinase [Gammaproteobacteria bacterium 42_54_T18]